LKQSQSFAPPKAGLPAGAPYAELLRAFEHLTADGIAAEVERLADAVRARRYPAGRPYRHVNGFTKVVASEYACGARLTLHYWPAEPGAAPDVSRPHDHRFPFTSVLLTGAQHFLELEETADPDARPWFRYVYRPYVSGRIAKVSSRGETRLRVFQTVDRAPLRGHYTTTSNVVHQAVTDRDTACATLVLRGPREKRMSTVYYGPGGAAPHGGLQFGRWLGHDLALQQIEDVLGAMSGR
jgi:hypothetical protein